MLYGSGYMEGRLSNDVSVCMYLYACSGVCLHLPSYLHFLSLTLIQFVTSILPFVLSCCHRTINAYIYIYIYIYMIVTIKESKITGDTNVMADSVLPIYIALLYLTVLCLYWLFVSYFSSIVNIFHFNNTVFAILNVITEQKCPTTKVASFCK